MKKTNATGSYKTYRKSASLAGSRGGNRGVALVFSIFLTIALEAGLVGGMFNAMRLQRQVQHTADAMRLDWAADALLERTIKLLQDYARFTGGAFPDVYGSTSNGGKEIIKGHPDANLAVSGGTDFETFLKAEFSSLKAKYPDFSELGNIDIEDIMILETAALERSRDYVIEVKAVSQSGEAVQATVRQEVTVSTSKLFDFSVFCNDDCEITAGPGFTLQGPIFSNENIYLMVDKGYDLKLELSDDFGQPFIPEPYIMHAYGNIYFYFKRAVKENYFLSNSIYRNSVSPEYKSMNNLEIYPGIKGSASAIGTLPYLYYFKNGSECFSFDGNGNPVGLAGSGDNCKTNRIFVRNLSGGYDQLFGDASSGAVRPRPLMYPQTMINWGYYGKEKTNKHDSSNKFYTVGYTTGATLSTSSAVDRSNPAKPLVNTSNPLNLSVHQDGLIKEGPDQVQRKEIPIGDRWIDPMRTTDTNVETSKKIHRQADLEFIINCSEADGIQKSDASHFFTAPDGVLLKLINAVDSRSNGIEFELDLAQVAQLNPQPKIIYFHVCGQDSFKSLKLINGEVLPENGLTVVSSGRIWVKGDYNIFDYKKQKYCTEANPNQPSKTLWDSKVCDVPPAAIFSDSFGVLSKQWDDSWAPINNGQLDPGREQRLVTEDVMINTALATGNKSSRLVCNPKFATTDSNGGCIPKTNFAELSVISSGAPGPGNVSILRHNNPPTNTGDRHWYQCPNQTYTQGININDPLCDYYREAPDIYLYYVNPKSRMYRKATRDALRFQTPQNPVQIPLCQGPLELDANFDGVVNGQDNSIWVQSQNQTGSDLDADFNGDGVVDNADRDLWANATQNGSATVNCSNVRIPIFADPLYGMTSGYFVADLNAVRPQPPMPGVHTTTLNRFDLTGRITYQVQIVWYCGLAGGGTQSFGTSEDAARAFAVYACSDWPGEQGQNPTNCCPNGRNYYYQNEVIPGTATGIPPRLHYYYRDYEQLYIPVYSGGMENLINLQEHWNGKVLRFLGTLSIPWESQKMTKDYGFYYYTAPERKFDYNENLRETSPPGTPDLFSAVRRRWSRRN